MSSIEFNEVHTHLGLAFKKVLSRQYPTATPISRCRILPQAQSGSRSQAAASYQWYSCGLSYLERYGHNEAFSLFFGRYPISNRGWTPLPYAARYGYDTVVRLLVETGKVNLNFEDPLFRTPLSLAVEKGHEAVVKVLLESGKVGVDVKDVMHGHTHTDRYREGGSRLEGDGRSNAAVIH